jgi:hypothetical protein
LAVRAAELDERPLAPHLPVSSQFLAVVVGQHARFAHSLVNREFANREYPGAPRPLTSCAANTKTGRAEPK